MMRKIVTSLGRTAFQSRNLRVLRMAARDEPAGFGANTGLNTHAPKQGDKKSWTADAKDQIHDFKKDTKTQQQGQAKAYGAETHKAANEGMTRNKETSKVSNEGQKNMKEADKTGKSFAGTGPHDTAKPWEAKNQSSNMSSDNMHKPSGQQGPGGFKSGAHQTDHMRTTGSTNQWEANHVHNDKCGHNVSGTKSQWEKDHVHNDKCGHNVSDSKSSAMSSKTCQNDSAACRMDSGKCSTHTSSSQAMKDCKNDSAACRMDSGKCSTHTQTIGVKDCKTDSAACRMESGKCSTHVSQKTDQGMMDKAMGWVKEKFGGATNQQSNQDIKDKNRATADSDKAFKDNKESNRH